MSLLLDLLRKTGWLFGIAAIAAFTPGVALATDVPTVITVDKGETVDVGGVKNILIRAKHPKGSILLLTGGDGRLNVMEGARFTDGADNVAG